MLDLWTRRIGFFNINLQDGLGRWWLWIIEALKFFQLLQNFGILYQLWQIPCYHWWVNDSGEPVVWEVHWTLLFWIKLKYAPSDINITKLRRDNIKMKNFLKVMLTRVQNIGAFFLKKLSQYLKQLLTLIGSSRLFQLLSI